jgi:cytochrome P450
MHAAPPLPPGKMGLPVIGETPEFVFNPTKFVVKRRALYGSIFKSHILGAPLVFMVGPEALRFVLSSHKNHFTSREGWPRGVLLLMGESLLMKDGEEHQRNRRLLAPAFSGAALASYGAIMEATAQGFFARWEQVREFAWYDEFRRLTFDIASRLLLGTDDGTDTAHLGRLFAAVSKGMSGIFPLLPARLPWTPYWHALRARDELLRHVMELAQCRAQTPSCDALSLMVRAYDDAGNRMSLLEVSQQALFLLLAGHESTTSLLTTCCLELARHPDVLRRAREEQREIARGGGSMVLERLEEMPYLDQTLLEAERLHPPFTGSFRAAAVPFEFNGFGVPAGWRILYSIAGTHQAEEAFPEPERFDPDRFNPEHARQLHQDFSLVAFGGGPRRCLGMGFAKLELKIVLAHLIRDYHWELLPGQRLNMVHLPSPYPKDRLRVSFRRLRAGDM